MEKNFDQLIDSFIQDEIGINEHFLSDELCLRLKTNLTDLIAQNLLKPAGIGNSPIVTKDKLYRSDKIYWLDRLHENKHENDFLDIIDAFVKYLNRTCYTGITGFEFHYALYQKGNFYVKHYDQFQNNDSRKYTMIMYLNEGWLEGDGGELCIHHNNAVQLIVPVNGKSVFFQSNLIEHEVLVTNQLRFSITGWLKVN